MTNNATKISDEVVADTEKATLESAENSTLTKTADSNSEAETTEQFEDNSGLGATNLPAREFAKERELGAQLSRDEMNLAEFPLTVLSTRSNPKIKTLEFHDFIKGKNGKLTKREWVVTGADKFGLPTSSDDEVLLGLLKLTVDAGIQNSKVYFTRYDLLKTINWSTEGRSYSRLQNALDRLSGVRIKATNAFFDNERRQYNRTKNFGVIDAYEIIDGRETSAKPSYFIWSEELFNSFQAGFIKKFNLAFYLDLRSAISKRLYRHLDKIFWHRIQVSYDLFTLAHEKIGVSRNYKYASSLKQQLQTALDELVDKDFLDSYEYSGKGKNTSITFRAALAQPRSKGATSITKKDQDIEVDTGVLAASAVRRVERLATKAARVVGENADSANDMPLFSGKSSQNESTGGKRAPELLKALVQRGIRKPQAAKLVAGLNALELSRSFEIVDYFDALLKEGSALISKSPPGFLYKAVSQPLAFLLPSDKVDFTRNKATRPQPKVVEAAKDKDRERQLEKAYYQERKQALVELRKTVEQSVLDEISAETQRKLAPMKDLMEERNFEKALELALDERLAEFFAFDDYATWRKQNKA